MYENLTRKDAEFATKMREIVHAVKELAKAVTFLALGFASLVASFKWF